MNTYYDVAQAGVVAETLPGPASVGGIVPAVGKLEIFASNLEYM